MRKILKAIFVVLITFSSLGLWAQEDDLARVSILKFYDNTKQQSFGYLSTSIAEAIDKSMQQRFEYKKLNIDLKKRRRVPNVKDIKSLARKKGADFIIYGHYNFDKSKNQILIYVSIYITYNTKNIKIDVVRNPVDASLFSATEIVAAKIVGEIQKIATEQEKEKESQITLIFTDGDAKNQAKLKAHARRLQAYLGQSYKGQYVTFDEYKSKNAGAPSVNEKKKLFAFLAQEGIKKSYHIKIKAKNFVVEAKTGQKTQKTVTYPIKSSAKALERQWSNASKSIALEKRKRVSLDKNKLKALDDAFINRKIAFGLRGGFVFPFVNLDFADTQTEGPMLSIFGRYRVWQMVHAGLQISRNAFNRTSPVSVGSSEVNVRVKGEYFSALLLGGYTYNLTPKWQLLGEIGFGYYFGETRADYEDNGGSNGFTDFADSPANNKNPSFMVQFELNYAILKWLAVGFHANYFILFDKEADGKFAPLGGAAAGIAVIFAF